MTIVNKITKDYAEAKERNGGNDDYEFKVSLTAIGFAVSHALQI